MQGVFRHLFYYPVKESFICLRNLSGAGCESEELEKARKLYEAGDTEALIRHFRKCRCSRMEELHESQRKVDCLDFLIRQTAKTNQEKI